MTILIIGVLVILSLTLLYHGRAYWAWLIPGLSLVVWCLVGVSSPTPFRVIVGAFAGLAVALAVPALRREVSRWLMRLMGPLLPRIGESKRIALDAGTVWWDRDLFSGKPDWQKLLAFTPRSLSEKERAFLDGPVEELCADGGATECRCLTKSRGGSAEKFAAPAVAAWVGCRWCLDLDRPQTRVRSAFP